MKRQGLAKKLLAMTLAFVTFGGVIGTAACTPNSSNSSDSGSGTTTKQTKYDLSNTTHIYDVKEGTKPLVENGKCDYTIVYPAEQANDANVMNAIAELKMLFAEATGISLQAKSDAEVTKTDKIISLGKTSQASAQTAVQAAMKAHELGGDGFVIESDGTAVYIIGEKTLAVVYGVYEFLKWQFNFEFFADGVYTLDRDVKNVNLKDFSIVDIPDFETRASAVAGIGSQPAAVRNRLRYETASTGWADGEYCHNFMDLLPSELYGDHTEWYSDAGNGLCLNAHGDAESLELMVDAVFNEYVKRFTADPNNDWAVFSQEDGTPWCQCPTCVRDVKLYDKGAYTAAWADVARFINKVARKLKVWNQENCPERDLKLFIFNYSNVHYAPVKMDEKKKPILDENGNYIPYSDEIILEDNVGVYMCTLGFANAYEIGGTNATITDDVSKMERAVACMKNPTVVVWTWSALFNDYLVPLSMIDTRQDYYQFFKSYNTISILDQGQHDNTYTSDWGCLKQYICAKLMWDCQLDVQKLIDDFMAAFFGDASEIMNEMYEASREWLLYLRDEQGVVGHMNQGKSYRVAKNFPYQVIQNFLGYIDRAYKAIEPVKSENAELYEQLRMRIMREGLTWRYLEIRLYPQYCSTEVLKERQLAWVEDAVEAGLKSYYERADVTQVFGG